MSVVRLFYFKCLFLSNCWVDFDQSWQVVGYTMRKYESQKLGQLSFTALSCFPWTGSVPPCVCPVSNPFFSLTAGLISTKVSAWLDTTCESMNLKNQEDQSLASLYKKSCPYVSIFCSFAFFSASSWPIWTKPGRKVGTVGAFINP